MFFQDRAKEIADASGRNRITEDWQKCYDAALGHLQAVCDDAASEATVKALNSSMLAPVKLGDFVGVMVVLKTIEEWEFREAGLYEAPPSGLEAEERRRQEWHLFHSNPLIWIQRCGHTRAMTLWQMVNEKLKAGPEPMKKL